ncbi:hypothetical protein OA005_00975 [Paracoccaceae bacterium]|nr:hypothetical protein [Paracoccaceae bacterium]
MLEKELNELSDETILTLYKSVVPTASIIESVNRKLERQSAESVLRNKKELNKKNDQDFRADKTFLNFQRHLIELKLLSVKILEEINKRDLHELDSFQRKMEEVDYVESCSEAVDNSPNLTSVPQGNETLPYLNREAKS